MQLNEDSETNFEVHVYKGQHEAKLWMFKAYKT